MKLHVGCFNYPMGRFLGTKARPLHFMDYMTAWVNSNLCWQNPVKSFLKNLRARRCGVMGSNGGYVREVKAGVGWSTEVFQNRSVRKRCRHGGSSGLMVEC